MMAEEGGLTSQEYRAQIKALGLTPARQSYAGATLHIDRDGLYHSIPDAESLTPGERAAFLALLKYRMGLGNDRPN